MIYIIILILSFSFSIMSAVGADSSVSKEQQDARLKELVAKKKGVVSPVEEVIAAGPEDILEESIMPEGCVSQEYTLQDGIVELLSHTDRELKFFQTVLFERNELSFSEKIAYDRIVQFVQNLLSYYNDFKNSGNFAERSDSLLIFDAYNLLMLIRETFMRLECLTIGRYESSQGCGVLSMPLSERDVKSIVLSVGYKLTENFEKGLEKNPVVFRMNDGKITKIEPKPLSIETIQGSLPEYLKITWANTLLFGGSEKKQAQEMLMVEFSPEVKDAYFKFLYEFYDAKKTGNYEVANKALGATQNLISTSKALCSDQESIEYKVLKIWDFKLRKMALQLEMAKKAKEFCTTSEKQEILIKHQITCNDVLLRGLVGQDREFAEYFDNYSRVVELYLFSKEVSPKLMVEVYQLSYQMKRMLEVHGQMEGDEVKWTGIPVDHLAGFSWVKTAVWKIATLNSDYIKRQICYWFYPPNLKKIYLIDMIARLEDVARTVNKKVIAGKSSDSNGVVENILQGGWAKQNDYGSILKDFLGKAIQGQTQGLKSNFMQMLGYASPIVLVGILKYLMPSLSGTIKQGAIDLLAAISNDPVAQKTDSLSQPVKEKVTKFLEKNPGLLDSVNPEQLKDLVVQAGAAA